MLYIMFIVDTCIYYVFLFTNLELQPIRQNHLINLLTRPLQKNNKQQVRRKTVINHHQVDHQHHQRPQCRDQFHH